MVKSLINKLQCLNCKGRIMPTRHTHYLTCKKCGEEYPVVENSPILLSEQNNLFPKKVIFESLNKRRKTKNSLLSKSCVPKISVNLARKNLDMYFQRVASLSKGEIYILVIGGGSQKLWLDKKALVYKNIILIYSDIDINSKVDLYCDAHELPFFDSSIDGVITTAVLEHVLYPEVVATEITRVIKTSGMLYSEIPFMQQVHEGAYDFTRYSLSGHRRVFNMFTEIDSGLVAGPGTVLVWSIENFILAFFSTNIIRIIMKGFVRYLFFWFKYFDYFFKNKKQAMDGASCTFFIGIKLNTIIADKQIINDYVGGKSYKHF